MNLSDILLLAAIGISAGFVAGSMGVGGGIIIVPALVFFYGMSQHQAQGTSLAVLLFPIGFLAVFNYYKKGYVNFKFALILIIAFVLGSYFGSLISVNLPAKTLKKLFGILMLAAGTKMILDK
ncbi:MAG: sulfite exporter TauE/SafE family protein [Bacteroidales bacterium]|nr:sulfite exporter TauE/SafE family protein [Bacteroidales bacterium]